MRNVLLVEDVDEYRITLCRALTESGYVVFEAASGSEALLYCRDIPAIHIALLDLQLPDMNGFELASLLQARYGDELPILYVSATSKPEMELLRTVIPATQIVRRVQERLQPSTGSRAANARG